MNCKKRLFVYSIVLVIVYGLLISFSFAEERFFEVKARKFSYTPNKITVNKGDLVKIRLISEDVQHGFYVDGYGIKTSAIPGREGTLQFIADKNGRFSYRCSVTCGEFHPYMIGYLTVAPNNRYVLYVVIIVLIGLFSLLLFLKKKKEEPQNVER